MNALQLRSQLDSIRKTLTRMEKTAIDTIQWAQANEYGLELVRNNAAQFDFAVSATLTELAQLTRTLKKSRTKVKSELKTAVHEVQQRQARR